MKRLMWAVLAAIGNGVLGWTVPGTVGAFFKVTAGALLLVVVIAVGSVALRNRKNPQ